MGVHLPALVPLGRPALRDRRQGRLRQGSETLRSGTGRPVNSTTQEAATRVPGEEVTFHSGGCATAFGNRPSAPAEQILQMRNIGPLATSRQLAIVIGARADIWKRA